MRVTLGLAVPTVGLLIACSSSTPTAPSNLTVVGYQVSMKVPVDTVAQPGDTVPVSFAVVAIESDGSSQPASGQSIAVSVTAGGGTLTPTSGGGISGATGARLTTAADGTASLGWTLGSATGTQTLRGSLSAVEYVDVNVTAVTP